MLEIVYKTFFGLTFLYSLYFVFTAVFSFIRKKHVNLSFKPKTRFKVIIPARNEEKVISYLINSLKKQNYPLSMYEVCVVINNCTDNTAQVAEKAGATVLLCDKKTNGKGDVLKWVINKYKNENDFDAYAIFDADNLVDKNFLKMMNNYYLSGYKVAQGFRDTKNISDTWISSSYALYYYFQNFFYNKSRQNIGMSASLNGTGFYADKEIVEKYFNTQTLTEDMEFTAICAINGIRIGYAEEAITYDEQATKFKVSWVQRKRWTCGLIKCLKIYFTRLIKKRNMPSFDIFMVFLAPFIQTFSFFLFLLYLVMIYPNYISLFDDITIYVASFLVTAIGSIFILWYYKKSIKSAFKGILLFTIFILSWLPINFVAFFTKNLKWVEIKHDRQIDMQKLLKEK